MIDAQAAGRIHPHDTFRIIRALETATATGEPITDHHRRHGFRESPFRVLKIGLDMDRQALYDRIDRRVDAMIDAGLLDEVRGLLSRGYGGDLKSMQSLGYRHMVAFTCRPPDMGRGRPHYETRHPALRQAPADLVSGRQGNRVERT